MSTDDVKTPNIALSGVKGSGKSLVTQHLKAEHNYEVLSFAGPIKRLTVDVFQCDEKYVYDPLYKETIIPELGVSARQLMQVIGTELFRDALMKHLPQLKLKGGKTVWIHSLLKRAEKITGPIANDDCRFDDEYEALHAEGFTVARLVRPSQELKPKDVHASEQGCPADVIIANDGSVDDLFAKIDNLVK